MPAGAEQTLDKATLERGQAHYLLFCANCYGADADGHGPLVGLLKVVPSNLTVLRRLGGPSVAERVLTALDGGHQVSTGEHKIPVFSEHLEVRYRARDRRLSRLDPAIAQDRRHAPPLADRPHRRPGIAPG